MSLSEDKFKSLWQETPPETNEDAALKKVLSRSSNITTLKDVTSLFLGWLWVVFLGFGASMYSAKRKLELHHQEKRMAATLTSANSNNIGESK